MGVQKKILKKTIYRGITFVGLPALCVCRCYFHGQSVGSVTIASAHIRSFQSYKSSVCGSSMITISACLPTICGSSSKYRTADSAIDA